MTTDERTEWRWQQEAVDAAKRGDQGAIARLLAEREPDAAWRMRLAIEAGPREMQRALLDGGTHGLGPALAAVGRDDEDAVRTAHADDADWHASAPTPLAGWSAVHIAAALGHTAALRALRSLGVEFDRALYQGLDKNTPLVLAMRFGRWDAARLLLDAGADARSTSLLWYLPAAPRALLAEMFARGLELEFVAHNAVFLAGELTPERLHTLMELGLRVDGTVLASVLQGVAHAGRSDAEHVALAEALLRAFPPPAGGIVTGHDGQPFDMLAHALAKLPLGVAQAMVAAGVTKRRARVGAAAPDAGAKRAWIAQDQAPRPADEPLPFVEFIEQADDLLTEGAVAAQWRVVDGRVRFGPFALGMDGATIDALGAVAWDHDGVWRQEARSESDTGHRAHRVMVEKLDDGTVFHVRYTLYFNDGLGGGVLDALGARLGKPTRNTQKFVSWLRGDERVSYGRGGSGDDRFSDELTIELLDERHKDGAMRARRFAKV